MVPTFTLVQEAQRAWSDPEKRTQIVGLHAQRASLLEMVRALGLEDHLDPDLRATIEGLSDAAVQAIRDVFIAEAAAATTGGSFFPIDCRVTSPGGPVTVTTVAQIGSGPVVQIT